MKEIKVPVDLSTKFSHFCDGCEVCDLTLEQAYGKYTLTCSDYRRCSRVWQDLCRRGLVKKVDIPFTKQLNCEEYEKEQDE